MSNGFSDGRKWWIPCLLAAVTVASLAGCDGSLFDDIDATGDVATVTVRLVNQSGVAVDPHLYIDADVVEADALFADATAMYANFNSQTTLSAAQTVSFSLPLAGVGTIGSNQAIFGSWTDGSSAGQAEDRPVLRRDVNFDANDVLVLTFGPGSNNHYRVTATVIAK